MGARVGAFWLGDDANPDSYAAELIDAHLHAAPRIVAFHTSRHPREDVEAIVMMALYRAAYSFRPGPGTFYWWWKWMIQDGLSHILRREQRHRDGLFDTHHPKPGETRKRMAPISVRWLSPVDFDKRFYYMSEG